MTIAGGIDGIIAESNAGGLFLDRVRLGNYGTNLKIDGALDFVFLDKVQAWPFEFSKAEELLPIWSDGRTVAYHFDEVDDLTAGSLTAFRSKVIIEQGGNTAKRPFGSIDSLHLDGSRSGLLMSDGNISIGNFYSTSAENNDIGINLQGGNLNIANIRVTGGTDGSRGLITISGGELQYGRITSEAFNDTTNIIQNVAQEISNFEEDQIEKLYNVILNRPADSQGHATWTAQLNNGLPLANIAFSFLRSQEATNIYGAFQATNIRAIATRNQIITMYRGILNRGSNPTQGEINNWSGRSIESILTAFLNSREYEAIQ